MRTLGWVLALAALLTGTLVFVACDSGSPTASSGGGSTTSPCYAFFKRYIISTGDGSACCDCYCDCVGATSGIFGDCNDDGDTTDPEDCDPTCNTGSAFTPSCCWGDGDWDMWVSPGGAGVATDGLSSEIEILLSSDPYIGAPGYFVVYFYGTLNCETGALSGVETEFCETMSGNLTSLTGTLTALDVFDCTTAECSSTWSGTALNYEVCGADWCYMCTDSDTTDFASSDSGRESPVLKRLRERGFVRPVPSASPNDAQSRPSRTKR